jgi:hypothetical protein
VPHSKLRQILVMAQIAVSLVLLPALDCYCAAYGTSQASLWACTPTVSSPPQLI